MKKYGKYYAYLYPYARLVVYYLWLAERAPGSVSAPTPLSPLGSLTEPDE